MARKRYGRYQTNMKRLVKNGEKSIRDVMTKNACGQSAVKIQDPAERLIAMIGASNNEPKYYPTEDYAQKLGYEYDASDFDEQAQQVIAAAIEVAESDSPRDLLAIAHWARTEMRMRTTPQVLLAVAAECSETKQFVREYAKKIIQRADELKQVFIAYRHLFGHEKSLPNSLKRGIADAFTKFKESQFLKYEGQGRPTFADVLKMVDRRRGYPLEENLDAYLKSGEVLDETKIPVIAARKKLNKCESFDEEAKELAAKSYANWEVVLSQFGNTQEVWEHLIDTEQLGYMAMLRNLRNILQAGVSDEHLQTVREKLVSGAKDSKQLPYRFAVAKKMLDQMEDVDHDQREALKEALEGAVAQTVENIPEIPGSSLIAVDTSGSMQSTVSQKSKVTQKEAASMLGSLVYERSTKASVIGAFADEFKELKGAQNAGILTRARSVEDIDVGFGTNAEDILRWALKRKKKFDRIIIFSDMETYGGTGGYGWYGRGRNDNRTVKDLIKEYRKKINPKCKLHTFDLAGSGRAVASQGDTLNNLVSGYSEKLLETILSFEGIKVNEQGEVEETDEGLLTLEYIRENF